MVTIGISGGGASTLTVAVANPLPANFGMSMYEYATSWGRQCASAARPILSLLLCHFNHRSPYSSSLLVTSDERRAISRIDRARVGGQRDCRPSGYCASAALGSQADADRGKPGTCRRLAGQVNK